MPIGQLRVEIGGFSGAPGQNTWHAGASAAIDDPNGLTATEVDVWVDALASFYGALQLWFKDGMTFTIPDEVESLNVASGKIEDVVAGTAGSRTVTISSSAETRPSNATMIKTRVRTGRYSDGREIRGGVYLGPINSSVLSQAALISPTPATDVENALQAYYDQLILAGVFPFIYRRPRPASSPLGPRPGELGPWTSMSLWRTPAVLRSRRD